MSAQGNWLWDDALEAWVKAPANVRTVRLVGAGQVIAGRHKLHWISCNPSLAASEWELTDATAAADPTIVLDHHHPDRESHNTNLVPPMQFEKGIYLETYTNMTSMTFGYT